VSAKEFYPALRAVRWLAPLSDGALDDVMEAGVAVRFQAGQALVGELELGDDLFVILDGEAVATVAAGLGSPLTLGKLGPGDACGELSLFTRELRSATVTATTPLHALRIERANFLQLIELYPQIAVHFAGEIGARLRDADQALDDLLTSGGGTTAARLSGKMAAVAPVRGSFARAWREMVQSRLGDLPFLALLSFVATLASVRGVVFLAGLAGASIFPLLRTAYTSGFLIVILATATALMRFRPSTRRLVALAYGVGFALIINEYSVFLAFDVFYIDMTSRDESMVFDVVELYRRSESQWGIALFVLFLLQATYLRRFYRRLGFLVATRLRRMF